MGILCLQRRVVSWSTRSSPRSRVQGRTLPAKPHTHARAHRRTLAATRLGVPEHRGTDRDLRCHPDPDAAANERCEALRPESPFYELRGEWTHGRHELSVGFADVLEI